MQDDEFININADWCFCYIMEIEYQRKEYIDFREALR